MKARTHELLRVTPFQPFVIRMADGREYRLEHPDFVLGRTLSLAGAGTASVSREASIRA
ncbi:MAG: hypothetical protein M3463_19985 [Verrucomicrobiota bacterium]|nr:hypothetical protein [Verrucomicrobiota bacterium]